MFADEFLPDSGFRFENPEGCELGPFSRSAGNGDKSGGKSRGLFDFDDVFESMGFEDGVFFLDCGESCEDCACCF